MRRPLVLMFQGTGSDVGKSVIVAGLCRAFRQRGINVAPFKPQNMSNNAAVTADGGEIGRAQALQACAARLDPIVHMNPVLLKPEADHASQIVLHGRVAGRIDAASWGSHAQEFLAAIRTSFGYLIERHDLILVEGAGSPAETNLRKRDVANMGFAQALGVPVVLIGDIDRGGMIASLVGTHAVLEPSDRARIRAFIVNKFRGNVALFEPALETVRSKTGWQPLGVIPWLDAVGRLPAEDAVPLGRSTDSKLDRRVRIVVPMLARIANFDDLDPLIAEPNVSVEFIPPGTPLPLDADAVILPGTKSTLADLSMFRSQGWDIDLAAMVRHGVRVLGLCGGYQMLGKVLRDPHGVDGAIAQANGLGLLNVETDMEAEKILREAKGFSPAYGAPVHGYEIHMGKTSGPDCSRPLLTLGNQPDGARSANGQIEGTYLHGVFQSDEFRRAWLASLDPAAPSAMSFDAQVEDALDSLAQSLEQALDLDALLSLAEPPGWLPQI
jgi:adenosylcobyric acid synthase